MKTTEVQRKKAKLLKSRGYKASLTMISTKHKLSYLRTLIRYEEVCAVNLSQTRVTLKDHHKGIWKHLVNNLCELEINKPFYKIQIYQRYRYFDYD